MSLQSQSWVSRGLQPWVVGSEAALLPLALPLLNLVPQLCLFDGDDAVLPESWDLLVP